MKKIETLKELKIEDAFQLLKDNNWRVENCLFSTTSRDTFDSNTPVEGTLRGLQDGKFTAIERVRQWNYCWLKQTKTHWELDERVKLINNRHTVLPVGSLGKVLRQRDNPDLVDVEFQREPRRFIIQTLRSEDLEPFDPYEEWWAGTPEPSVWKTLGRDAWEAGREYERTQHAETQS